MRYELAERQVVAVSPLLETSPQPCGQVHGCPWGPRRGGGEGSAGQGGSLRGGQKVQLLRGEAAHEHPHEDEKGGRRVAESLLAVMGGGKMEAHLIKTHPSAA